MTLRHAPAQDAVVNVWEAIYARRAVRAYSADRVEDGVLKGLLRSVAQVSIQARVSGIALFKGRAVEKIEGRVAGSKRVVLEVGFSDDAENNSAVSAQGPEKPRRRAQDIACTTPDERVIVGGRVAHQWVLEHQGAFEREQSGVGDVEDDEFGSDEQATELVDGHRLRAEAGGLGFGAWAKTSRKSFSSSRGSSRSAATASSSSARFISTR